LAEKLLSEQNFSASVIVGAVATLLATAGYVVATAKWDFSYGFAAVGIGIAVGISMQYLGRGIQTKFAVTAAVYTIAGCIVGNSVPLIMSMARENSISPLDVLRNKEFSVLAGTLVSYISMLDLVFWLVAIWFAVFLVKRPLSRSERLAIGMYNLKG
jgi:hypothetical protein